MEENTVPLASARKKPNTDAAGTGKSQKTG